jgi:hypothetical protein
MITPLIKKVIFIRHGQAEHNVGFDNCGTNAYYEDNYRNSSLTIKGISQAQHLRQKLMNEGLFDDIEIVFTSPLDRAIQTTLYTFYYNTWDSPYNTNIVRKIPLIAIEDVRESGYEHPCNSRRILSEINDIYPQIDTQYILTDDDVIFKNGDQWNRFDSLIKMLKDTKYNTIAVVSHGVYLYDLLNDYLAHPINDVDNCQYVIINLL